MISFKGQFLVAMPDMSDERFHEAVIYVITHDEDGAMGLVVNHAADTIRFADVIEELQLGTPSALAALPKSVRARSVLKGGPVEPGRGFVLHGPGYGDVNSSIAIADGVHLNATLDMLRALAFGPSPEQALFALGYCGWGPQQLEAELAQNGWLTVPYSADLLFALPLEERYRAALSTLGITRASLSREAGHG